MSVFESWPLRDVLIDWLRDVFCIILMQVTLTFYAICITLNAYHRHPSLAAMSNFVRVLVVNKLGRIFRMEDVHNKIRQRLKSLQDITSQAEGYECFNESITENAPVNTEPSARRIIFECRGENITTAAHNNMAGGFFSQLISDRLEQQRENFPGTSRAKTRQTSKNNTLVKMEESSNIEHPAKHFLKLKHVHNRDEQRNVENHFYHCCECNTYKTIATKTHCSSFLNETIAMNHRLVSNIQEINYLKRCWELKLTQKEQWITAASILDKALFILFLIMFTTFTVFNFL